MNEMKNSLKELLKKIFLTGKAFYHAGGLELTQNELAAAKHIITHRELSGSDITMSELAEALGATKPAVSQLIGRLEEKELVERAINKHDRRLVTVKLTKEGFRQYECAIGRFEEAIRFFTEQMGDKDLTEFVRLIDKAFGIMKEYQGQNNITEN